MRVCHMSHASVMQSARPSSLCTIDDSFQLMQLYRLALVAAGQ
jgi:hypothetical protein